MKVLLTKAYKGRKPGDILANISSIEANAVENLGLGTIMPDEAAEVEAPAVSETEEVEIGQSTPAAS
ncbi:hypothetical protein NAC44_11960 [Allorhizobium sp. BGMRC 0089]|uniref:hypothetical protein n=1 Tax=Allorhizobium sonneratiae TaxID=2934936 RepID=UPI002033BCFD|nr:hypothetical protein [Allorhizobium sonneratiae]MCM2293037.1 hypothetical protein [Allorhizobium sonneratiae]